MTEKVIIVSKGMKFPEARVVDDSQKELYNEVREKSAEKFGENSPAYKTITNGIRGTTGSQFFWNTNLGIYLPENQRVVTMQDWEEINDINPTFIKGFYTDFPSVVLRSSEPSREKNKYVLENLVSQVGDRKLRFSSENPLVITNPELVADTNSKNEYGLLLKIIDQTEVKNDLRLAYANNNQKIPFGQSEKTVWTKKDGLSRLYVSGGGDVNSDGDGLAGSDGYGRVVLRDDEGVVRG